jgi:hypothetical protein
MVNEKFKPEAEKFFTHVKNFIEATANGNKEIPPAVIIRAVMKDGHPHDFIVPHMQHWFENERNKNLLIDLFLQVMISELNKNGYEPIAIVTCTEAWVWEVPKDEFSDDYIRNRNEHLDKRKEIVMMYCESIWDDTRLVTWDILRTVDGNILELIRGKDDNGLENLEGRFVNMLKPRKNAN